MKRARWNTELLYKKLNFVNLSKFWGSYHFMRHPLHISFSYTASDSEEKVKSLIFIGGIR